MIGWCWDDVIEMLTVIKAGANQQQLTIFQKLRFEFCSVIWCWRADRQELKSSVKGLSEASMSTSGFKRAWHHQRRNIWTSTQSRLSQRPGYSTPGGVSVLRNPQHSWTHRFSIRRPWCSLGRTDRSRLRPQQLWNNLSAVNAASNKGGVLVLSKHTLRAPPSPVLPEHLGTWTNTQQATYGTTHQQRRHTDLWWADRRRLRYVSRFNTLQPPCFPVKILCKHTDTLVLWLMKSLPT